MERDYKYAVYIGRFQPFHNGHLDIVKNGLKIADKVVILVGSTGSAPNIRNPWSFEERKWMILASLAHELGKESGRVSVLGIRDYFYNENTWITQVQAKIDQVTEGDESVALIGSFKDASSYYLKYFPEWEFVPAEFDKTSLGISSTAIRERLFRESFGEDWEGRVPDARRPEVIKLAEGMPAPVPVRGFLGEYVTTKDYVEMAKEHEFITKYKASWDVAPFPPIFVTTDAIVVCSGHVLVVERKRNPGKGLFALPGGFIKNNEKIQDSMLRELKEETKIKVDKIILESEIVASKVFDHPQRSLRGRTITHGYYIKLKDGKLPEVKGADDASRAFWMPLADVAVNESRFFEDHASIIHYFAGWS